MYSESVASFVPVLCNRYIELYLQARSRASVHQNYQNKSKLLFFSPPKFIYINNLSFNSGLGHFVYAATEISTRKVDFIWRHLHKMWKRNSWVATFFQQEIFSVCRWCRMGKSKMFYNNVSRKRNIYIGDYLKNKKDYPVVDNVVMVAH